MRRISKNCYIALIIAKYWLLSFLRVSFQKPSRFLPEIILDHKGSHSLSKKEWSLVRKTVKGVRKISPLFARKRKCLMEALIVYETLKSLGIASMFRLGAKSKEQKLSAHAWVSVEDKIVIGGPVNGYEELVRTH